MRTAQEYYREVIRLIAVSELTDEWIKIRLIDSGRASGVVRARDLRLTNGALFGFTEDFVIEDRKVRVDNYSYDYKNGDFKFHYDKDSEPQHIVPFSHSLCHLHVIHDEPRFITHETNLPEILGFIKANFYA